MCSLYLFSFKWLLTSDIHYVKICLLCFPMTATSHETVSFVFFCNNVTVRFSDWKRLWCPIQEETDAIYLFSFTSFFVSLSLGGDFFYNRRIVIVVAIQDLTAAFDNLLDRWINFLDTVLHLEGAFGRSGDKHTETQTRQRVIQISIYMKTFKSSSTCCCINKER